MRCVMMAVAAGMALSAPAFVPKSMFIGRMGERVETPENTLRAYKYAIDNGFPVEFDLWMTKDGELVAVHDENLRRKYGVEGHPTNLCWKGVLENVDAGAWKPGSWMGNWKGKGIRIPRIDEILALLPSGTRNVFHLRDLRPEACRRLREAVGRHRNVREGDVVFPVSSPLLRELFPKARHWTDENYVRWDPAAVTEAFVAARRRKGQDVHVWTDGVMDPKEALEAIRRGVASITSDSAPYTYHSAHGYSAARTLDLSPSRIQAHRGDSELAPENTMPAYVAAAKAGFPLEIDLYMTQDGVVFCTHDQRMYRRDTGLPTGAWSTNLWWKGQLDRADAGAWMGAKWKGTPYPRLEEVLPLAKDYGVWINVEVKDPRKDLIMPKVREIMSRVDGIGPSNIVFNAGRGWVAKNMPDYRDTNCMLLRKGWLADDPPLDGIALAKRTDARVCALFSPRWDNLLVTEEVIAAAHANGVKVCVWAVDDAGLALEAFRRGCDYVCSNRPTNLYREMCAARDEPVERTGDGSDDRRWHSESFAVEPNATYALGFEMKSSGGGGCLVSGVDAVNVDFSGEHGEWAGKSYVFRTLAGRTSERLHFGLWHFKGTVAYRKPVLEKVRPVHETVSGLTLGAGEQIEGSVYGFTSQFSGFALNDARPLAGARNVGFNTSRWCLTEGSEVTYRHAVEGRRLHSGALKVGCCHRTRGEAVVEASPDGRAWTRLGAVTNVSEFAFAVPASFFPAKELWVRFAGARGTDVQIASYSLDARIDGDVLWACGGTRYVSERTGRDVGGTKVSPYFATDYGELVATTGSAALWRTSSGRKVPPSRVLPEARAEAVSIRTAANEAEAAQLVVTPKAALGDVRVTLVGDLASGASRIPAACVDILRVVYVNVRQATDSASVRGLWPDPLPPQDGRPLPVAAGMNQPFWIRVKPPKGTPKGTYRGELRVRMDAETVAVPLEVEVFGFDLPDTMTCETAFGAGTGTPCRYHGAKTKAERTAVTAKYLKALADCHLSPYDPTPGVSWRVTWKDDEPVFDWAAWDAAMEKAIAERHVTSFRIQVDGLGGGTFYSRVEPKINGVPATDPRYETMMGRYLRGIESHLRGKGWLGMAYVYWFDEPDAKDYPFVMNGFRTLKRHAPGLRRMLTEHVTGDLVGGPDVWCPHTAGYDAVRAKERRAAGETMWWYVCCSPKAPYAGEFIDHPSNELRTWLWQTWGEQVSGILIWETLYWHSPEAYPDALQNPYEDPMSWLTSYGTPKGTRRPWGNGDGRLFYPPQALADGRAAAFADGDPVASFRSEGLRDGLEDYEYFAMLKRLDPKSPLLAVPKSVSVSLTEFSADPTPLEEHRLKLAHEIERMTSK